MALAEVGRFHTLSEAHVAASFLRSAGIDASVADAHYGSVFWMEQRALGGYRLSVPEQELADAVSLLRSPPPPEAFEDDEEPLDAPLSGEQRVLAAALALLSPAFGWLAVRRGGPTMAEAGAGTLVALTLLFGLLAAAAVGAFAVYVLIQLIANPP